MMELIRCGHTFTPEEHQLEIRYITAQFVLILVSIVSIVSTIIFYNTDDIRNAILHLSGTFLSLFFIYLLKIMSKAYYTMLVHLAMVCFFLLIMLAYYYSPNIYPVSAWIVIEILVAFLVFDMTLGVLVGVAFSLFIFVYSFWTSKNLGYILLQILPVLTSIGLIIAIDRKFQKSIQLLEKFNYLLEERVEARTLELEEDKLKLEYQANYDDLTSLPNRLLLRKELEKRFETNSELSLFVIDLDGFKKINDVFGHLVGDKVLQIIAKRLKNIKYENDFLSRMSGDEFVFISKTMKKNMQRIIALSILNKIEEPISIESKTIHISAAIGVSTKSENINTTEKMITYADIAMYEAKKEKKGNFKFYKDVMMEKMQRKVTLETEMKQAFINDAFVLHYQPQIDVATGKVFAIEVLTRWEHPEKGLIFPNDFIRVAEEIDMIVALDYHVLSKGMFQIVNWLERGYEVPRISFNISGKHLQEDLYLYLKSILDATECPTQYVELEITEGYLVNDTERAIYILEKIKSLGIHIAIDDFGRGYSSLSYLKSLPINKIKIDKSFIDNVNTDNVDASIVQAIMKIANSLDISVVSEGVETKEQKEYLVDEGCKYIQGYYYHKPMDIEKLEKEILHHKA